MAVAAAVILPATSWAQAGALAVINTDQILGESAAGMAAGQQFEAYAMERQQALVALQAQITQKTQEYESQQRALSPEALNARQQELTRLNTQFTREQEDYQADMAAKQQELLSPVIVSADEALTAYTAEQSFRMVLDLAALPQGAIVYLDPAADVTSEVIRRMDEAFAPGGGAGETLPPPPATPAPQP
jgi:outer membrane protein